MPSRLRPADGLTVFEVAVALAVVGAVAIALTPYLLRYTEAARRSQAQADAAAIASAIQRLYFHVGRWPFNGEGDAVVLTSNPGCDGSSSAGACDPNRPDDATDTWDLTAASDAIGYGVNVSAGTFSLVNLSSGAVLDTLPISNARRVAVSPDGSRAYVTSGGISGPGTVHVIDTASRSIVGTIGVGSDPQVIAVTPDGTRAYVGNYRSNNVSVIDTATNTVTATISGLGPFVAGVAVNSAGTRAYVANEDGDSFSVINTSTNTILATVGIGRRATGVAVSPDGSRVYVSSGSGQSVTVIDAATNAVLSHVAVGGSPVTPVPGASGAHLYVPLSGGGVAVLDTSSNAVVQTIPVSIPNQVGNAQVAGLDASGQFLYVSTSSGVAVIDTATHGVTGTLASSPLSGVAVHSSESSSGPADSLANQLVTNGAGYPTSGNRAWRGPYLPSIPLLDPWGHSYLVNIQHADAASPSSAARAVIVISSGPDGRLETPADRPAASNLPPGGDDVVARVK